MKEAEFRLQVHQAMDHCLSGVQTQPFLSQRILHSEEKTKMKRKMSLATVLLIALLVIAVTAVAAGIYESIKPAMDSSATLLISSDWSLEEKLKFLTILQEYGVVEADNTLLQASTNEENSEEIRSESATALISQVFSDLMQDDDDSIVQPWEGEEDPKPTLDMAFEVLYRSLNPDADEKTISEAYDRWLDESRDALQLDQAAENLSGSQSEVEQEIWEWCWSSLTEIHNMNQREQAATTIDIQFHASEKLWTATFTIGADDLRQTLRNEWGSTYYDAEQNVYTWTTYFLEDGTRTEATSLEEYLYSQLIPRSAWPNWDQWEDDLRAFLYCTTEERAEFSSTYKPVVDQFLSEHPDMAESLANSSAWSATYMATRHCYGIPDEKAISEEQAIQTALNAWMAYDPEGVWPEMIESDRGVYILYDITDAEHPVWKVGLQYWQELNPDPKANKDDYFVMIDAYTGEILKEYSEFGDTGMAQYCETTLEYVEKFL